MRVLITPEWYPWPDRPVFGVFCREQARAVARVQDVAVLTWRLDPTLKVPFQLEATTEEGLRTFRVRFGRARVPKATYTFKLAGCLAAIARLRRERWSPDVIHAHEYIAGPIALSLGALAGAPVIFSEHYSGFGSLSEREQGRAKWAFERASLVCPVSGELTGRVRAVAPGARVEAVPNVVDTDVFISGAARRPTTPPRLITVGSLIERKGHRHLIAALALLRGDGPGMTLDIIGDGPLRIELEALAGDLGVKDLITFHGGKSKPEVAAALRRADVFVLPSLWENMPCAMLEAMSTGLPVVASGVGGVPEVVGADQGILVAPASSAALAEGLREMAQRAADYDREALRATTVARFGHAAIGRRWAEVYAAVVGHGPTRRWKPRRSGPAPTSAGTATAARPRRVLALAYFFPPLGGGGVQRTLKHVKYLPNEGFQPIVLTTRLIWSPMRDATLGAEVPPGTVVIRAPEIPLQLIKWGLHGALRRARLPTAATSYIGWPDEMVGWVPAATWRALGAVRRYRPDVLYSTSSPVSAHLVALIVSRICGIPWVADFRDGWTRNPQSEPLARPLADLSARLERAVVRRARYLIVVDESVELLGIEPGDPRLLLIRNGVDPEDVPAACAYTRGERFRMSYVGMLYGARDAAPIFAALRALIDRGAVEEGKLDVRLVGPAAIQADPNLERLPVTRTSYVDHATAIAEMASADVLLFYAPALNRAASGKIYEYLVAGRPILCVAGSDNFAFGLVQQLGAGHCAEPGDQPAIEAAIEGLYHDWEHDALGVSPQVRTETLRRFSRRALARELAVVLAETIGAPVP